MADMGGLVGLPTMSLADKIRNDDIEMLVQYYLLD